MDLQTVTKDGPWNFDNNFLVPEQFNGALNPLEYKVNRVCFWVQVIGPPVLIRLEIFWILFWIGIKG